MEQLQKEITSILGTAAPAPAAPAGRMKKRTMSAAARRKLSEFQKARWAKIKGAGEPAGKPKKKFTMSAAAKAAISRAAKARWAKIKAAQKK